MNDGDLLANLNLLFAAGFETTSYTISFTLLELATHPDVQASQAQMQRHVTWPTFSVRAESEPGLGSLNVEVQAVNGLLICSSCTSVCVGHKGIVMNQGSSTASSACSD